MNCNKNLIALLGVITMMTYGLSSCEKAVFDEEGQTEKSQSKSGKNEKGNVTLRVSTFDIVPFDSEQTRSSVDITTYCSRLNFVVYKDGKKVDYRNQVKGNSGFGEVSMSLSAGTYQLLVVAHSSLDNPTLSNAENIKFTNATGYTDTFSYYGELEVTNEAAVHDITLTRNVSCVRFTVADDFPDDVMYMSFYYKGGSGVLNAVTGYGGIVNSEQEKLVKITGYSTPLTFNLFTFLQSDEASLYLKVTALKSDKTTKVLEREFSNIPMKYQKVTEYTGSFFSHDTGLNLIADTDWGEPYYHFDY